tara:strand:- start:47 stop:730 length:684 start_codon:yes stop_codon:yes gene_type:complete
MEELKSQKCNRCKTLRKPSDFVFNEKPHKNCIVCSETTKKYREKNKEKLRTKHKEYRVKNKEKIRIQHKEYRVNNPEKNKEMNKNYRENNPEKIKEINKNYYVNQVETNTLNYKFRTMIQQNKQRDLKTDHYDADNLIDIDYLNQMYEIQNGLCIYCKCLMNLDFTKNYTNKISIQRINNDYGHIKMNCVFSCFKCNVSRQENKHDETQYIEILDKMGEKCIKKLKC